MPKEMKDWVEPVLLDKTDKGAAELAEGEDEFAHLVKMARDGEELHVHPSCVAAHQAIGWKQVA